MTKKITIPWDLKYDFAMKAWASNHRGFLYALREKYGATAALEMFEKVQEIDDRVKDLTNTIRTVFKLEGNDATTIGEVFDLWDELTGTEHTVLERSQTINRRKVTQCPFKTGYNDISDWSLPFVNIITKTINPKATLERPKGMCAGDPYCEYVWKLEESTPLKGAVKTKAKEVVIPWELKYKFAFKGWESNLKGHFYAIREKYGAAAALEIYERFCKMGDRIKNLTNTLLKIFKIEGNDVKTIMKWWEIWYELTGMEVTTLEWSKTKARLKVTRCPWKTEHKDISDWNLPFLNIVGTTINLKATIERPKRMCAGDPYCEYIFKIEE